MMMKVWRLDSFPVAAVEDKNIEIILNVISIQSINHLLEYLYERTITLEVR